MLIEKLPIFLVNTLLLFRSHKHSFTPYPSLSPYSPTDRITDRGTHSLRMGWRNLFSSCAVVSVFWLWREIVLGVTYLPYLLCRCVFFLVAAGNSFGLHRSVFWLWREIVLGVTYSSTMKARENIVQLQKTIHNRKKECTTAKYIAQQLFHLHISKFVCRNNIYY
jgi:hypothetical protein